MGIAFRQTSDYIDTAAETAAGDYPVEAVRTMADIIEQAEASGRTYQLLPPRGALSVPLATCRAGCRAAFDVGARYLVAFTDGGFTARQTARFRPEVPILAFTPHEQVARALNMLWGVEPRTLPPFKTIEEMMRAVDRALLKSKLAERNDLVVVLAGSPIGVTGSTNLIKVHRVGQAWQERRGAAGRAVRKRRRAR